MSLSKFYKSSDSFEPEKIVKQDGETTGGWQSTPREKSTPFEQQQLTRKMEPPPEPSGGSPDRQAAAQEKERPGPAGDKAGDDQAKVAAAEEQIDLSDYIPKSELEKQLEQAYQRGLKDRSEKVSQDYETATRSLLLACRQLDEIRNTIINNSSRELQDFALSIAERILRISVTEQDSTIIATIEEALQRAVKSDEFTIFIHPGDFDVVMARSEDLVNEISGLNNLVIKKDNTVERGGARIESDNCIIDATISSQFDAIREEIKKNS